MPGTTIPSTSAPSTVFIVRHGSRLDAADKDWSQSSATPYDTPLTYGGWVQSRNLGVRIGTLLKDQVPKKKKQTRIVIHTSPFLRCIQTAVSIASGLAQYHHQQVTEAHWTQDENGQLTFKAFTDPERFVKPVLRLDAWLGEWMTMDYYSDITPPPISQLMVGTARSEYMRAPIGIQNITKSPYLGAHDVSLLPTSMTGGFVPPSPSYAVSTSGTIPQGYVSQAKDYVDFDYAWDSTRLGQGAELGEEWSSMHKRFRNGWKRLMRYYHDSTPAIATSTTSSQLNRRLSKKNQACAETCGNPTPPDSDDPDEDDIETVVIVVTHGAGCNALLGAITEKPVLIDIGICSLTMGVLSPIPPPISNIPQKQNDLPPLPFSYNLKLTANTEHMRPPTRGTSTITPPLSPFLSPRPRESSGLKNFVLTSSGVSATALMGCLKTQRSKSQETAARPTGLWTMPRPEDRERRASRSEELTKDEVAGLESLSFKEKQVAAVPEERSGCTLDGDVEPPRGLWAARTWDRPSGRRWTVGREAHWNTNE
jgi:broad specificity phosphatase PhoE